MDLPFIYLLRVRGELDSLYLKSFNSGSENFFSASGNYWQACAKGRVLHLPLDLSQCWQPDGRFLLPVQLGPFTWGPCLTINPYSSFTSSSLDVCPKGTLLGHEVKHWWAMHKGVIRGFEMPKIESLQCCWPSLWCWPTGVLSVSLSLCEEQGRYHGTVSGEPSFLEQAKLCNNMRRGGEQEPELLFHGKHHIQNWPLLWENSNNASKLKVPNKLPLGQLECFLWISTLNSTIKYNFYFAVEKLIPNWQGRQLSLEIHSLLLPCLQRNTFLLKIF